MRHDVPTPLERAFRRSRQTSGASFPKPFSTEWDEQGIARARVCQLSLSIWLAGWLAGYGWLAGWLAGYGWLIKPQLSVRHL